ncbi:hypothetical protein [Thalassobacillus sp. CUG 92003]|uniref:hypothetical protein n=1 Tax=Thalassobacillus sp. CUG 92003 TaxID=2736641 RepID=UPI0015E6E8B6|nr:hypothetical protein [Thalassobacillus sp. CUG 92003]
MTRLTTQQLEDMRNRADERVGMHTADDVTDLVSEVETLIAEKADARRKLDTVYQFIAEYERQGVYEMSTELLRALLVPTKEALTDAGE